MELKNNRTILDQLSGLCKASTVTFESKNALKLIKKFPLEICLQQPKNITYNILQLTSENPTPDIWKH
jgi:hypothetical protein